MLLKVNDWVELIKGSNKNSKKKKVNFLYLPTRERHGTNIELYKMKKCICNATFFK